MSHPNPESMIAPGGKSTQHNPRLSQADVALFTQEGFLLYNKPVLPLAEFTALKNHFEKKLSALPPGERPEGMDMPHLCDTELFRWLFSDSILSLVEPILGPNIALFASHFLCKPKGDGRRVPWHEDSAYWKKMISPMNVVTVWLAIDPSLPENGCMQVIPRSHRTGRMGFSDYAPVDPQKNVFNTEIVESQRDESRAVSCVLHPNECSLHDARTQHGSAPNHSALRRCGYTMRYMSTDCRLSEDASKFHQVYLARGVDLAGQEYADPERTYEDLMAERVKTRFKGH